MAKVINYIRSPTERSYGRYRVVLENEQIKVVDYRDEPGDKTRLQMQEESLMLALGPFKRRLTFMDGAIAEAKFSGREVMWNGLGSHVGENIGDTPTHVLIVELKQRT